MASKLSLLFPNPTMRGSHEVSFVQEDIESFFTNQNSSNLESSSVAIPLRRFRQPTRGSGEGVT